MAEVCGRIPVEIKENWPEGEKEKKKKKGMNLRKRSVRERSSNARLN